MEHPTLKEVRHSIDQIHNQIHIGEVWSNGDTPIYTYDIRRLQDNSRILDNMNRWYERELKTNILIGYR